jgi:hypothetical protein
MTRKSQKRKTALIDEAGMGVLEVSGSPKMFDYE